MTRENKELLAFEKWDSIFRSGNKKLMNDEMENLQDALNDIKSEDLDFEEMNQGRQRRQEEEMQPEDIYVDREKKVDFTIFGFNFTKLDNATKNFLGIFLIICVFAAVILGLNWIRRLRYKETKKDKKKRQ